MMSSVITTVFLTAWFGASHPVPPDRLGPGETASYPIAGLIYDRTISTTTGLDFDVADYDRLGVRIGAETYLGGYDPATAAYWSFRLGADPVIRSSDAGIEATTTRYGFEFIDGVSLFGASVVPYFSSGYRWSSLSAGESSDARVRDRLSRIEGTRFGHSFQSGVTFKPHERFAIDAAYDSHLVNPRTIFWEWYGSFNVRIFPLVACGFLSRYFAIDEDPALAVTLVALEGAWSYFVHEMREDDAHWPFSGEAGWREERVSLSMRYAF